MDDLTKEFIAESLEGLERMERCLPELERQPDDGELMAEVFPGVALTRDVGEFGTLLSIDRARAALGFAPEYSWRDELGVTPG